MLHLERHKPPTWHVRNFPFNPKINLEKFHLEIDWKGIELLDLQAYVVGVGS